MSTAEKILKAIAKNPCITIEEIKDLAENDYKLELLNGKPRKQKTVKLLAKYLKITKKAGAIYGNPKRYGYQKLKSGEGIGVTDTHFAIRVYDTEVTASLLEKDFASEFMDIDRVMDNVIRGVSRPVSIDIASVKLANLTENKHLELIKDQLYINAKYALMAFEMAGNPKEVTFLCRGDDKPDLCPVYIKGEDWDMVISPFRTKWVKENR